MIEYIYEYLRTGEMEHLIETVVFFLSALVVVFLVTPFHEFAHAYTAHKLGDDTARYQGRMTLNPFAHIDWFGATMIMLCGYGFAKPVSVNVNNFRYSKVGMKGGMAITALAGPVSNVLAATVAIFFCNLILFFEGYLIDVSNLSMVFFSSEYVKYVFQFLMFLASINLSLAVFNFIPIPPLDGSKVLFSFLPYRYYFGYMKYERYISLLLIILVFSGWLDGPIGFARNLIFDSISYVTWLPFKLF